MTLKAALIERTRSRGLQAGVVAAVAYVAAVVVNLVTAQPDGGSSFWILLAGGLIACVGLSLAAAALEAGGRAERQRLEREHAAHRSGYQTLNREISGYIALARRLQPADPTTPDAVVGLMRNACRDLYETLETEYGYKVRISEHIEFEVTFMTLSPADGKITIAAWANRNARAPNSLAGRSANPDLYSGTETFLLYEDPNRSARFVSTTSGHPYKELYPGQLKRIKSSVIWPVLDDGNALQGTLVVHCDLEGFFSDSSQKLWGEMLEPYTKRLALARVLADRAHQAGMNVGF